MRRVAARAALPLLILLSACTSSNRSPYGPYFKVVKESWHQAFGDGSVTRDQAAAIPFATIGYRLNGGAELILVLATDNNSEQMWTAASRVVLSIQDGRIKRTLGLPHDLAALTPAGSATSLAPPGRALQGPFSSTMTVDFPDLAIYDTPLQCRAAAVKPDTIQILGHPIATTRIDEDCNATAIGWRYQNNFWVDPQTGFVWRSRQSIHPKGDTLDLEVLRPPG